MAGHSLFSLQKAGQVVDLG